MVLVDWRSFRHEVVPLPAGLAARLGPPPPVCSTRAERGLLAVSLDTHRKHLIVAPVALHFPGLGMVLLGPGIKLAKPKCLLTATASKPSMARPLHRSRQHKGQEDTHGGESLVSPFLQPSVPADAQPGPMADGRHHTVAPEKHLRAKG